MSELRASLLVLGVVFIAALAWWERRRPRQARAAQDEPPGPAGRRESAGRREPALELPEIHAHEPLVPRGGRELPILEVPRADEPGAALAPEPGPADAGELPGATAPVAAVEPGADSAGPEGAPSAAPAAGAPAAAADTAGAALPALPGAPPPLVEWPPDEQRRVVALRLVAPLPERFAGRSLRQALAAEGFVLGRFDIFHKPDEERRAVLSAASLTRPGTFDAETMDSQHYGGLSLFAVLPGPKPPPQAFDELVSTARSLNDRLCGVLQDESGTPLTPARIATLRERVRAGASS